MNPSLSWGFHRPPIYYSSFPPISSFSLSPRSPYFVVNNAPPRQARKSVSPDISPVIASSLNPYQAGNWIESSRYLQGQGIDVNIKKLDVQKVEAKTKASAKTTPSAEAKTINATASVRQPQNHEGPKAHAPTPSFWASILNDPSKQKSKTKEGLPENMLNVETIKQLESLDPKVLESTSSEGLPENMLNVKTIKDLKSKYERSGRNAEVLKNTIINTIGNNEEVSRYVESFTNSLESYLQKNNTSIGSAELLTGFAESFIEKYSNKTLENGQNLSSSVRSDNQSKVAMIKDGNPVNNKASNGETHKPVASRLERGGQSK
jgi:hypothetical protein